MQSCAFQQILYKHISSQRSWPCRRCFITRRSYVRCNSERKVSPKHVAATFHAVATDAEKTW